MSAETLQDVIAGFERFGSRRALGLRAAHGARWWTYERLTAEAHGRAELLAERGVGRGERIALWAPNTPEWSAAALGAILRGAVVVPIDAGASAAHAARVVERSGARLVLHTPEVDAAALRVPAVGLLEPVPPGEARDVVSITPDDAAFLLFTSGSTRDPRGVLLTHRNLAVQAASFERWRFVTRRRGVRLLALSPLSHVQGVVMGLTVPLSLGLSVLYSTAVDPAHVIAAIRHNRINLLLAVPGVQRVLADALREEPQRDGRTLAERAAGIRRFPLRRHVLFLATHRVLGYSFWVLLVGGATLDPADERWWYECGYVLVQGYGLTETTAIVSVRVNSPFGARLGSVGRALSHHDVRIADDGEVLVRGPSVSRRGDDPAHDGFLQTGDLGALDARGRLWLRGRKQDLIVTAEGENVHVEDVESRLRAVAGVRDAVVGDAGGVGEVHAVLLLENGTAAAGAVATANAGLEPYQRVRSWSVWPEPDFPRSALLKVRRPEVIGAAPASDAHPRSDPVPTLDAIRAEGDRTRRLELLAAYLAAPGEVARGEAAGGEAAGGEAAGGEAAGGEAAGGEAAPADLDSGGDRGRAARGHAAPEELRIEDLGLSSLDAVELAARVEGLRSRALPQLAIVPATRVADLRAALAAPPAPRERPALPERQPRWSPALPGRALRVFTRPLLIGAWAHLSARIDCERPRDWSREPCILAVAPHRHWLDAFVVQACLPRRTPTVTVTNRDFAEHFAPGPDTPRSTRFSVGLAYHLLWPMLFEFVIVPNFGSTRTGLLELGAAIDRGRTPISFPKGLAPPGEPNPRHESGVAWVATQTGVPVVPVWIAGNDDLPVRPRRHRTRVSVRFGDRIPTDPRTEPGEIVERVESAYTALAG